MKGSRNDNATKVVADAANAHTLFSEGGGLMATKQKSADTPEQAARRRSLAENCLKIFGDLTNDQVHQIFVNDSPINPSLQAIESLRRTDEAPHSKSKTVTALATLLQCDEETLFTRGLWKSRDNWLSPDGHFLPVPKKKSASVAVAEKPVAQAGVDSPVARDLRSMTPLFQKAIHSKPAEVVETCEQIVETEYRHLFAYFVYWMQDQTKAG